MNQWLQLKYIQITGINLRNFKRQDAGIIRCSCPFCGDSTKDKTKARFYFLESNKGWRCYCHHCQWSGSFDKFLKKFDTNLYNEYRMETFKELGINKKSEPLPELKTKVSFSRKSSPLDQFLDRVDRLPDDNLAVQYVTRRMIPRHQWSRMFFIDDIQKIIKDMARYRDKIKRGGPRLILPCFNRDMVLIGLICRALDPNDKFRYLNLSVTDDVLIFGQEKCDFTKHVFVTEGPIDSLFLPNSIAVSGTSMGKIKELGVDRFTVVLDNQPRNKEVLDVYSKMIDNGYQIFIPPDTMRGKDLNDCVVNGMLVDDLKEMIVSNTYQGMTARLKFSAWRGI